MTVLSHKGAAVLSMLRSHIDRENPGAFQVSCLTALDCRDWNLVVAG